MNESDIINESLNNGLCPSFWKETLVVPIQKVPATCNSKEFRPVHMCPIINKLLQTEVKNLIEEYVFKNNILSQYQSGFRSQYSCETAINLVLNEWKEVIEQRKKIIVVFLDMQRAFETVDREILLKVLHSYGIRGSILQWFSSWLS